MKYDYYIETLQSDSDPLKRRLAAEELIALSPDKLIIEALVRGAMDADRGVSDICVHGLTSFASALPEYSARLIAPYIADNNIERRNLAGDLLPKFGELAAPVLVPYLSSLDPDVRKFACDVLGLINNKNVIADITRLIKDPDANVRCSAVESLGHLGASTSLPSLLALYETDEEMRPYIITAAGEIGDKEAQDFLLEQLKTQDEFLQVACIDALAVCGNDITIAQNLLTLLPQAIPALQLILLKTIYGIAFRLEEELPLPDHLRPIARQAMLDSDEDIRMAGLIALGNRFLKEDIPALLHHLMLSGADVQQHIMQTALLLSSEDVAAELVRRLFSMMGTQYCNILETLGYLPMLWQELPSATTSALINMFFSEYESMDSETRVTMIDLLLSLERESAVRLLERELKSEDDDRIHDALVSVEHYHLHELSQQAKGLASKEQ